MIKKLLLAACLLSGVSSFAQDPLGENEIHFQVKQVDPTKGLGEVPRSPIHPLYASLDDHTLYISGVHSGYTLYLIDNSSDDADVVYQVVIPAGVNVVYLPATLSGTYELQLHKEGSAFYFYTEISY